MAYRRQKSTIVLEDLPSENLDDYITKRRVQTPTAAQFKSVLKGYFEVAQKGDLALIPPSAWRSEALLVEFTGSPENIVYRKVPYSEFLLVDIPARRFREVATVAKRFLPSHILDVATKPNAFVQFGKTDTIDLYDLTYGSFAREGEYSSTFYVTKPEYNLEHDLLFAAFVKFIAANSKAAVEGMEVPYTLEEAFLGEFGDYTPSLQSNVNSPGWLRLKGNRLTPLVAAVLFSLAVEVGADAPKFAEEGIITIGNSMAPADDPCVVQVHQEALDLLKFLKLGESWVRICEAAYRVKDATGIHSQPRVLQQEGP